MRRDSPQEPDSLVKHLRPDMSVRLVAYNHPETREVFLRHGEENDRGVFGHLESLEHFARRRGVGLDRLLDELATATGLEVDRNAAHHENLHRPFVLAALVVTLTLGAGWGAHLLTQIGLQASFNAALPAYVIAHGAAQLWGFVALFIVGIAMRYLISATGRPAPPAAARGFVLCALVAGVFAGFAWSVVPEFSPVLGPASGVALLAGAGVYLMIVYRFVGPKLGKVWARFVLAAAAWLSVWAAWTLVLQTRAGMSGPSAFSATDRQLVMDLALLGLALGSVYGFGRKLLPGFLATGKPRGSLFEATFWLHNGGLIALLMGRLLSLATVIAAGLCSIGAGAIVYVAALRGLRGRSVPAKPEQGHPFLRRYIQLAFLWLLISLLGFAVIALIEAPGRLQVPHAIHGAIRHAMTVGFLVTLILGVGQRLLPILGHTLLAWPRLVVPIFFLIAVGNLLRVASEVATSWWTPAFLVMPFSAALELAALTLFAANAIRTMWPPPDPLLRTGLVGPESRAATLLSEHPWIEDELIAWGMDTDLAVGPMMHRPPGSFAPLADSKQILVAGKLIVGFFRGAVKVVHDGTPRVHQPLEIILSVDTDHGRKSSGPGSSHPSLS